MFSVYDFSTGRLSELLQSRVEKPFKSIIYRFISVHGRNFSKKGFDCDTLKHYEAKCCAT